MQNRTRIEDLKNRIGETVTLAGWVDVRRDHGQLIFFDLRDGSGKVQLVVGPGPVHETADKLRPEWVIEVIGQIKKRPEKMVNSEIANGDLEVEVGEIKILNQAETPPFDLQTDGRELAEEIRLEYRYLDLRRPRLQQNLHFRHRLVKFIRDYLSERGFIEVETPILSQTTPEGARDYLVPSRLQPGQFYALPQSPQQYKQLLMVAGVEKYFQIARCFRDEDTRGDRQPEFTQLDLEMAFVEQEEVMILNETLLIALVKELLPGKKILQTPFPRLTYREAMDEYGSDRPDLRPNKNDSQTLAFCWITDFPFFEKTETGAWTFTHNPFSAPKPEFMEQLLKGEKIGEIITSQYDIVLNGSEIGGGSIRNHRPEALRAVFRILGYDAAAIARNFGHLLQALARGAPPHGGIAWGLDRLVSILAGEPNIREVIAFPKTGEGRDLLMGAPAAVTPEQLKELKLKIDSR
ncbi:MAG: aspartate--tRNA ligase [Candidatus Vogelbacteria bacterium]|nr:aspartate--tRNA ligase [Candidatus Vogelbacteria bacterium]